MLAQPVLQAAAAQYFHYPVSIACTPMAGISHARGTNCNVAIHCVFCISAANMLQICAWGEHMDNGNMDGLVWQTGGAAAERFWGTGGQNLPLPGVGSPGGLATDDRYNRFLCHLRRFGITAAQVMPSYCGVITE